MEASEKAEQSKNFDNEEISNSESESVRNADAESRSPVSYYSAEDDEEPESTEDTSDNVADSAADAKSVNGESDRTEEEDASNQETVERVDVEPRFNETEETVGDRVSADSELKSSINVPEIESGPVDKTIASEINTESRKSEDSEAMEVTDSELEGSESNSNIQLQETSSKEGEATDLKQQERTNVIPNENDSKENDCVEEAIEPNDKVNEDNRSNEIVERMEVVELESEINENIEKSNISSHNKEGEVDKQSDINQDKESAEKEPSIQPEEIMEVIESETEHASETSKDKTDDAPKMDDASKTDDTSDDAPKTDDDKNEDKIAESTQAQPAEVMEVSEIDSEKDIDKNDDKESEKNDTQTEEDKNEDTASQAKVSEGGVETVIVESVHQVEDSSDKSSSLTDIGAQIDESILPDTEKHTESEIAEEIKDTDSNEQYIVTNYTEKSSYTCMQCNKSSVPKYICVFEENTSHICSDVCLDNLKEKKSGKVIVRGLRVKMFASEDLSCNSPLTPITPTLSSDVEGVSERCKHCSRTVGLSNYFSWNTFNFCNGTCLGVFQKLAGIWCVECKTEVPENLMGKYSVRFGNEMKQFCKNACLLDHKKGQKFCSLCQGEIQSDCFGFCSKKCYDVHNSVNPKKVGSCAVCLKNKVLEIEFENDDKAIMFCGEPCFVAYKFVNKLQPHNCEFCKVYKSRQSMIYSFSFGGASHYLCSKDCQKLFIITNRKIVHCLWCNVKKYNFDMIQIVRNNTQFVICSLNCYNLYQISLTAVHSGQSHGCDLCHKDIKPLFHLTTLDAKVHNFCSAYCLNLFKEKLTDDLIRPQSVTTETGTDTQVNGTESTAETKRPVKKIVVVKPRPIPKQRNISTMCKPYQITKSINCRPKESQKSCQTDVFSNKFFLPVPVPIYVPAPAHMYTHPVPMPVPFPLPIPVPIFIPTTRKSANGIMKEINKIKNKVPADPLEAELLMMAEMVAGDKKDDTDSESDDDTVAKDFPPEPLDTTNNSFGEDVLQMALKMASDFEEPVDLEGAVSATTISAQTGHEDSAQRIESIMETKRRNIRQARQGRKKQQSQSEVYHPSPSQAVELEKPDANMCLKYTFGVNAWKQWVTTKNLELQKTSKRVKLFKTEILQLTADELNFSLCLFVKEVRKPNGTEYAPDTIYYLCLGIQQYLYENGRIDNIFCDTFYEKFTDCLNEVCRKFSLLYNESQYIVTRVEEEHLWESKQLGAHSPLVLLNTLMFFNTKHFSLTTVDEHLQLSFSHIMKHWKRNPNQPGARNVLLRFYPPQTSEGPRKKKVYEQQENEDNPLRCPVKLYEFYMSKCPESVKTRNDVFYLQPERSCVPDSPVWYSTMALGKDPLEKMLNRVKMVKEINIALLTT